MKYIKLFENWLSPENHMDKIDSISDTDVQIEKNKLSDKIKNQNQKTHRFLKQFFNNNI